MRFEDHKENARRRKNSWLMGLICGPAFALTWAALFFFPMLFGIQFNIWLTILGAAAIMTKPADLLGKRLCVTAEQFSGPVAACCTLSLVGLLVAVYVIHPF